MAFGYKNIRLRFSTQFLGGAEMKHKVIMTGILGMLIPVFGMILIDCGSSPQSEIRYLDDEIVRSVR
jgi:hypothetical protein